jgi:phosphate starvation-inducible PhoH-like protein
MPKVKRFDSLVFDGENNVRILQRESIRPRDKIRIRDFNWTDKQKQFINLASSKNTKIILVKGPAGSSKTLISVYSALHLLNDAKVSEIIYLRSAVESSDARLGFLPGDADQKLHFFNLPFMHKMEELINESDSKKLQKDERISCYPVNFSRGMSWDGKCMIMDEAQNSSVREIITVLTRLGMGSKCFVLADPNQTDLKNGSRGGFNKIYDVLNDKKSKDNGIFTFEFAEKDIVRSDLVRFLVGKLGNIING